MTERIPLLIDTDPGVDDALALLLAFADTAHEVIGLTIAAGNVGLDHTVRNALKLCEVAGRSDVPVYPGCPGPLLHPSPDAADVHGLDGFGDAVERASDDPKAVPRGVHGLVVKAVHVNAVAEQTVWDGTGFQSDLLRSVRTRVTEETVCLTGVGRKVGNQCAPARDVDDLVSSTHTQDRQSDFPGRIDQRELEFVPSGVDHRGVWSGGAAVTPGVHVGTTAEYEGVEMLDDSARITVDTQQDRLTTGRADFRGKIGEEHFHQRVADDVG